MLFTTISDTQLSVEVHPASSLWHIVVVLEGGRWYGRGGAYELLCTQGMSSILQFLDHHAGVFGLGANMVVTNNSPSKSDFQAKIWPH